MNDRPKFFDDLAGVAGGAVSALAGLRDEAESLVRAQIDEAIRRLDLVRRDELQAALDMAAAASNPASQHLKPGWMRWSRRRCSREVAPAWSAEARPGGAFALHHSVPHGA